MGLGILKMQRKNSRLNRPKTLQYKVERLGGTLKFKIKNNAIILEIKNLSKVLLIPIIFSHFPHGEIVKETNKKITIKVV